MGRKIVDSETDYDRDGICEAVKDLSAPERSRLLQLIHMVEALRRQQEANEAR